MFLSVKIVLVKSIERIHAANLVNFGILPLVFKFPEDFKNIDEKDCMEIVNIKDTLENNLNFEVFNKTKKLISKPFTIYLTGKKKFFWQVAY